MTKEEFNTALAELVKRQFEHDEKGKALKVELAGLFTIRTNDILSECNLSDSMRTPVLEDLRQQSQSAYFELTLASKAAATAPGAA